MLVEPSVYAVTGLSNSKSQSERVNAVAVSMKAPGTICVDSPLKGNFRIFNLKNQVS